MNEEQQTLIRAWVEAEGCAVGSISCLQGGDLSASLVSTLWKSLHKMKDPIQIIFVRNSLSETQLLEFSLKESQIEELKEMTERYDGSMGHIPRAPVVLIKYHQLLDILAQKTRRLTFPYRAVIVFEHELDWGWEKVMAREQVAMIVRDFTKMQRSRICLKILGLSYHSKAPWLKHLVEVIGHRSLTIDMAVGGPKPRTKPMILDYEDSVEGPKVIKEISAALSSGKNVIIWGYESGGRAEHILRGVMEERAGEPTRFCNLFLGYPEKDDGLFERGKLRKEVEGLVNERVAATTLAILPWGAFSTPLPVANLGLMVFLGDKQSWFSYKNETCTRLGHDRWPLQQEYELSSRTGLWPQASAEHPLPRHIQCFSNQQLSRLPQQETDSMRNSLCPDPTPLYTWLRVLKAYDGQLPEELPMIEEPRKAREHQRLLQIMGLVVCQDKRLSLTADGRDALFLMRSNLQLGLETAVLCAQAESLDPKIAKCITRMALIGQYWTLLVSGIGFRLDKTALEVFGEAVRNMLAEVRDGGPGIKCSKRGWIYTVWIAVEDALQNANLNTGATFILPKVRNGEDGSVFKLKVGGLHSILKVESHLNLRPVAKEVWAEPLQEEEEIAIEQAFLKAYYPMVLGISLSRQTLHPPPTTVWSIRTNEAVELGQAWDAMLVEAWQKDTDRRGLKDRMFVGVPCTRQGLRIGDKGQVQARCIFLIPMQVFKEYINFENAPIDARFRDAMF